MIALLFRHASQCLTLKHTKSISLADLIFMTFYDLYIYIYMGSLSLVW